MANAPSSSRAADRRQPAKAGAWRRCTLAPGRGGGPALQGDPLDSQWADENAIWQDGGTMTLRPDGALDAFVSKFTSQASQTDADGHPV